jgi:hypothetical protein
MKAHRVFLLTILCLALAFTTVGIQAQDAPDIMNPATFGLQEGKPYDGTTLEFLICCNTAQQFALLDKMSAEEFTAMTGVVVNWGDVPWGTYQETLYLESSNPSTDYDIVAWVDAWGTNIMDFLYPLNDFVAQYEIDMSGYSPAYVSASMMGHLWGAGTDIFDENWEPAFNNEAGLAATVQYLSYLRDGYTAEQSVTLNEGDAWQEVLDGRAAMYVGWWWRYSSMLGSAVPEVAANAGIAAAPGWEGGSTASYDYLWPVGVLAQSDDLEASLEFMRWLTHPVTELRSVSNETGDPAYDNNVAVTTSVLQDENYNTRFNGLGNVAANILADARTIPLIPEYTEIIPILAEMINELSVDPNADVQAVLDMAAEDVRDVMDSAGYYNNQGNRIKKEDVRKSGDE